MKHRLLVTTLGISALMAAYAPAMSWADPAPLSVVEPVETRPSLVIIRFNKPNVYFEKALYTALSKALEAKEDVMFDLVSVVPAGANAAMQEQNDGIAKANMTRVLGALRQMGMPQERLTMATQISDGVSSHEVRVLVR